MATKANMMSSQELHKAQSHLWNDMFAYMRSFSVKSAIELGIPDAIHNYGKPIALANLAAALSIPPGRVEHLRRFMGLLVYTGYFDRTVNRSGEDVYSLNNNSKILVKEHDATIAPLIGMVLNQPMLEPWQWLAKWFVAEGPPSAFEMCYGMFFWEATGKMPDLGKKMREGLDSDSAAVGKVIIEDCADQLQGVKSLVEVAGNTGKISQIIAKAFPGIKCSLLELPHVIEALEDKSDAIEYVAGDMFKYIPPADVLIFKWTFMTWNDENCVKILKRCKEAIPTKENGGKVIIIDKVIDKEVNVKHPKLVETQLFYDMEMLTLVDGKQRTEDEWKKLFAAAGFKDYKIVPAMGMRCIIEVYH